ncbi:MAG: hypothetical protein LBB61_06145, partial [Treponema sp.]|nr:hypothetical protein [Treponema sp.]
MKASEVYSQFGTARRNTAERRVHIGRAHPSGGCGRGIDGGVCGSHAAGSARLDEVGSALTYIAAKGPSASEAAIQIRAAETAPLNPNKELSGALKSAGIESGSAMLKQYGLAASLDIVKQARAGVRTRWL